MKIYDCFLFYNELDLLDMRLHELNHIVDFFVLVEAKKTFTGKNKELYYKKNQELFRDFQDKIIHVVVDYPRFSMTKYRLLKLKEIILNKIKLIVERVHVLAQIKNVIFKEIKWSSIISNPRPLYTPVWNREIYLRNAIMQGLIDTRDEDIILISDVDEIPSPEKIQRHLNDSAPITFQQKLYYYFINCLQNQEWSGTIMTTFRYLKSTTPQELRSKREKFRQISNAGWHFCYLGGVKRIVDKIQTFSHTERNKKDYVNTEKLSQLIKKGKDLYGRSGKKFEKKFVSIDSSYPKCIFEMIKKYPYIIYEE
ncbi:MAG: hypothetical protein ACTSQ8_10125 [Candidatus Helarchaeota archaeon]